MATSNRRPPEVRPAHTHEGGAGYVPGVFDELLLTAASTYLNERTFYERAEARADRLIELTHEATQRDPKRTAELIARVREEYKIRHAALLMAVEYVRAGGPNGRQVIDSVIQRPDEPAEILAYFQSRYGGRGQNKAKRDLASIPWAIRRGVADGLARQLNERNYLKYVGSGRKLVTMADAIEITHPRFEAPWKNELARYILDEAHHGDGIERYIARRQEGGVELPMIYRSHQLGQLPEGARRDELRTYGSDLLDGSGYTWERLSGWLPGGMDAEAWEAVIPNMGVMALLRNLRNFDEAKISPEAQAEVERALTNADAVLASRIFPYRVWSAYKNAPSDRWKHPLGTTLDLAVGNVPSFDRTLFLVDVSGSMTDPVSGQSKVARYELATVMGMVSFMASTNSTLALFAAESATVEPKPGASTMAAVAEMIDSVEAHLSTWLSWGLRRLRRDPLVGLGQGTRLHTAIYRQFDAKRHDRVIVFTDEQAHDDPKLTAKVPEIVYFNLAGYQPLTDWGKRRIHIPGFSDAAFRAVAELGR